MANGVFGRFFAAQPAEEEVPETEAFESEYYYEDEEDNYADVTQLHPAPAVVETRMTTCRPRNIEECGRFVPELVSGVPVILDISGASEVERTRVYDFACGVVAGCSGSFSMVTQDVYLLVPEHVTIAKLSD